MTGMTIVLKFHNGDVHMETVSATSPVGRLQWRDKEPGGQLREFWLDTEKWAKTGRAVYREVPNGDD